MIHRDFEALTTTELFQEFCVEFDIEYLFHKDTLFLRSSCLLMAIYGYTVESTIYFRVYSIALQGQSSIDTLMEQLPDETVLPVFSRFRERHREPVVAPSHPSGASVVLSQEAYFFAYLEIVRTHMRGLMRCDLTPYAGLFRSLDGPTPDTFHHVLGLFQAGWGRSAEGSSSGGIVEADARFSSAGELASFRVALAHASLVAIVHGETPGSRSEHHRARSHELPAKLEEEATGIGEAVRDASRGDFERIRRVAAAFRGPGTSLDLLSLEHAAALEWRELRWAAEAVRRTADAVVRLTEGAGAGADDAPVPGAAPAGTQAVELALYRVALAHDQLRREASELVEAGAMRDDADAIRAALRATHGGDPGAAALAAEAARERARQVLALARAHGGGERVAAAAAELALWADQALKASPRARG